MQLEHKTTIGIKGNVVLPLKVRKYLNIGPGDQILFVLDNEQIKIMPMNSIVKKFQDIVKALNPNNISLVDSLKETRNKEAENE